VTAAPLHLVPWRTARHLWLGIPTLVITGSRLWCRRPAWYIWHVMGSIVQTARISAILLALAAFATATPSWGQDAATAEALFQNGLDDMEAGRFATGCPALAESHRLDPRPGTLFTLAECEAHAGLLASAVAHYGDYLALFSRMPGDQRQRQQGRDVVSQQQITKLNPLVPRLIVVLSPNAPAGTLVRRDGVVLGAPSIGIPLPVNPGEHELATQAPNGALTLTRVTLAQGETKRIELTVAAAPPSDDSHATAAVAKARPIRSGPEARDEGAGSPDASRQVWVYILGGLAVEGLAVGAASGILAWDKKRVIERECDGSACSQSGLDAADSARSLGTLSTVSISVGAAALVGAWVLWATAPQVERESRAIAPVMASDGRAGYVGLRGGF